MPLQPSLPVSAAASDASTILALLAAENNDDIGSAIVAWVGERSQRNGEAGEGEPLLPIDLGLLQVLLHRIPANQPMSDALVRFVAVADKAAIPRVPNIRKSSDRFDQMSQSLAARSKEPLQGDVRYTHACNGVCSECSNAAGAKLRGASIQAFIKLANHSRS